MNLNAEHLARRSDSDLGVQSGFSLVEMLVVIAVIGIIAAIAVPSISNINESAKVAATAADFRNFASAFRAHAMLEGEYPGDTHEVLPATMPNYLAAQSFEKDAPIGGRYNWEGPESYPYAGISLTTTSASIRELTELDQILDDGNLNTGFFRRMNFNGRYTYVIEFNH